VQALRRDVPLGGELHLARLRRRRHEPQTASCSGRWRR
jgi:hypothetical protein